MSVALLLRETAEQIGPETWCQGDYAILHNGTRVDDPHHADIAQRCTLGHLAFVALRRGEARHLARAESILSRTIGARPVSIGDWNDEPGRTAGQVRELLLRAAEAAEVHA